MDRVDKDLLEKTKHYTTVMAEGGLEGIKAAMIREVESGDAPEEFRRVLNPKGEVLAATDMSSWGSVETNTRP